MKKSRRLLEEPNPTLVVQHDCVARHCVVGPLADALDADNLARTSAIGLPGFRKKKKLWPLLDQRLPVRQFLSQAADIGLIPRGRGDRSSLGKRLDWRGGGHSGEPQEDHRSREHVEMEPRRTAGVYGAQVQPVDAGWGPTTPWESRDCYPRNL